MINIYYRKSLGVCEQRDHEFNGISSHTHHVHPTWSSE